MMSHISADEMAGFACEPELESRVIIEKDGDTPWRVHGPIDESLFASFPEAHWTLLLQSCNQNIEEFAQLL